MSEKLLALYEYVGHDWVRIYDQAAIDEATGIADLRAQLAAAKKMKHQFQTLIESQEGVITEQRARIADLQAQLRKALETINNAEVTNDPS